MPPVPFILFSSLPLSADTDPGDEMGPLLAWKRTRSKRAGLAYRLLLGQVKKS